MQYIETTNDSFNQVLNGLQVLSTQDIMKKIKNDELDKTSTIILGNRSTKEQVDGFTLEGLVTLPVKEMYNEDSSMYIEIQDVSLYEIYAIKMSMEDGHTDPILTYLLQIAYGLTRDGDYKPCIEYITIPYDECDNQGKYMTYTINIVPGSLEIALIPSSGRQK